MKIGDLKDGVYRLTCEVKNPHPDRRMTRNWTAAVTWPAGLIVTVSLDPYLAIRAEGHYDIMGSSQKDELAALVPALEPAPRNFRTVMLNLDSSPRSYFGHSILRELARSGVVSLAQIEAAHAAYHNRTEEEDGTDDAITDDNYANAHKPCPAPGCLTVNVRTGLCPTCGHPVATRAPEAES